MSEKTKFILDESALPTEWYNINADLPVPLAPTLNPRTLEPATPDDFAPLFPMALILQEVSGERWIEIPEPIRDVYRLWRPTPLIRARRLEKVLDTPAHIYFKYEGVSPVGSHKPNTAVAQAYYNKEAGVHAMTTETGAGQWGSALAFACRLFEMDLEVYMVRVSYEQKPYRRVMMESYGASVFASPSERTNSGRAILAESPDSSGSLGIAISEAVEAAATSGGTKKYGIGSVLNHVLLHQTVIGLEALQQMEMAGEYPDILVGCTGGGSNFAGLAYPFVHRKLVDGIDTRVVAAEPLACPSLTRGVYSYDYGDTAAIAPVAKMYTLGHTFIPAGIHAGGLRYHGMAPTLSALVEQGVIEAKAVGQLDTFKAAVQFAQSEGIVAAPESAHAIRVAIDEAVACRESGEGKTILFNLSGHGHFDMAAYDAYLSGQLEDYEYPESAVAEAMASLPQLNQ